MTAKNETRYRILKADGRIRNAGTDEPSWFTLEQARAIVDYERGESIVEDDGVNILWQVF